jgi:hypothetical protein
VFQHQWHLCQLECITIKSASNGENGEQGAEKVMKVLKVVHSIENWRLVRRYPTLGIFSFVDSRGMDYLFSEFKAILVTVICTFNL